MNPRPVLRRKLNILIVVRLFCITFRQQDPLQLPHEHCRNGPRVFPQRDPHAVFSTQSRDAFSLNFALNSGSQLSEWGYNIPSSIAHTALNPGLWSVLFDIHKRHGYAWGKRHHEYLMFYYIERPFVHPKKPPSRFSHEPTLSFLPRFRFPHKAILRFVPQTREVTLLLLPERYLNICLKMRVVVVLW